MLLYIAQVVPNVPVDSMFVRSAVTAPKRPIMCSLSNSSLYPVSVYW